MNTFKSTAKRQYALMKILKGSGFAGVIAMMAFVIMATTSVRAQQYPQYSQYMFNMLNINPAYAGNRPCDNITFLGRKQWVGLDGAPVSGSISWDRRKEDSNVGYGAQLYYDKIGLEQTVGLQAFYSYRIAFQSSSLTLGLDAGMVNYRGNFSQADTWDPDRVFQEDVSTWKPTVGFGILYAGESYYAGFSIPTLLRRSVTTATDTIYGKFGSTNNYFLTGGYIFRLSDAVKLKPSVLLKATKGAPVQCDLNLNVWLQDIIGAGVSFRAGDALIGMVEFQLSPQWRVGYAYDYTLSDLTHYNSGTHEIMLRYEFGGNKIVKVPSPRYY
jgi:type IX secretion system PorP/SprF family membrane protein